MTRKLSPDAAIALELIQLNDPSIRQTGRMMLLGIKTRHNDAGDFAFITENEGIVDVGIKLYASNDHETRAEGLFLLEMACETYVERESWIKIPNPVDEIPGILDRAIVLFNTDDPQSIIDGARILGSSIDDIAALSNKCPRAQRFKHTPEIADRARDLFEAPPTLAVRDIVQLFMSRIRYGIGENESIHSEEDAEAYANRLVALLGSSDRETRDNAEMQIGALIFADENGNPRLPPEIVSHFRIVSNAVNALIQNNFKVSGSTLVDLLATQGKAHEIAEQTELLSATAAYLDRAIDSKTQTIYHVMSPLKHIAAQGGAGAIIKNLPLMQSLSRVFALTNHDYTDSNNPMEFLERVARGLDHNCAVDILCSLSNAGFAQTVASYPGLLATAVEMLARDHKFAGGAGYQLLANLFDQGEGDYILAECPDVFDRVAASQGQEKADKLRPAQPSALKPPPAPQAGLGDGGQG